MSLISPRIWLPPGLSGGFNINTASVLLDASGEKFACWFRAPETGVLEKFEFLTGSPVSVAAGSTVRASFQDISATQFGPDETQDEFRDIPGTTFAANSWITPGLMTSDGTDGGTKRSVSKGDLLACVLEYQTFTAGDAFRVAEWAANSNGLVGPLGYPAIATRSAAGSWSQVLLKPILALKYSTGDYRLAAPFWPAINAADVVTFNNTSTPNERGLAFQLPLGLTADAAFFRGACIAGADFQLVVYDSANTVLASISKDADTVSTLESGVLLYFSSPVVLFPNVTYRLAVKPTTVNSVVFDEAVFASAAIKNSFVGSFWKQTSRTGAGPWTDDDTRVPMTMGFQLTAIADSIALARRQPNVFVAC